MTPPKNGNGTRWTIGILVTLAVVLGGGIAGWTLNHHESDMLEAAAQRVKNADQIGEVAKQAAVLDARVVRIQRDVAEIKSDVKLVLGRMPG